MFTRQTYMPPSSGGNTMQEFLDAIDTQAIDELSDEQVRQVLAILERAGY